MGARRRSVDLHPPAVIDREHLLLEDVLGHDSVKHWSDAIDGSVRVPHPQDAVKLGKDEGHGRQRGGFSKHLNHRNTTDLQADKSKVKGWQCSLQRGIYTCIYERTTTTSSLRNPLTFPEAYWMENPVPFSM